jgi:hypothetical protein
MVLAVPIHTNLCAVQIIVDMPIMVGKYTQDCVSVTYLFTITALSVVPCIDS